MAELATEMHVELPDEIGRLAEMTGKISEAGVSIRSMAAWVEGDRGHLVFIPDDPSKLAECKAECTLKVESHEVICVELADEVGALNMVAKKLAIAGIGIRRCIATVAAGSGKAMAVLETSDNAKAAELL